MPGKATWDDARSACRKIEGEMAAPGSMEENEFMVKMADGGGSFVPLWIGCNDKADEGTWMCEGWKEGDSFFNWRSWEPNNVGGGGQG